MLSEARARLANTQGKKAKRKARERQLEESRRLSAIQKRRELKSAGINTNILKGAKKWKGGMDLNTDIPFHRQAPIGFHDISDEVEKEELQSLELESGTILTKLEQKRRMEEEMQDKQQESKKLKTKSSDYIPPQTLKAFQDAEEAAIANRKKLILPAPQMSDSELSEIIKMGKQGLVAKSVIESAASSSSESFSRGLLTEYEGAISSNMPIRTPRTVSVEQESLVVQARNLRAMTEAQTPLLGGSVDVYGSVDFTCQPKKTIAATPNPLAAKLTPKVPSSAAELMDMTPKLRDQMGINTPRVGGSSDFDVESVPGTPRSYSSSATNSTLQQNIMRAQLKNLFSELPKPKNDFEIVLPTIESSKESKGNILNDAEDLDANQKRLLREEQDEEFRSRSSAVKMELPRPLVFKEMKSKDPIESLIFQEIHGMMSHDALQFPVPGQQSVDSHVNDFIQLKHQDLVNAYELIQNELKTLGWNEMDSCTFDSLHETLSKEYMFIPKPKPHFELVNKMSDKDKISAYRILLDSCREKMRKDATAAQKQEKRVGVLLGGYMARAQNLEKEIQSVYTQIQQGTFEKQGFELLRDLESIALPMRLSKAKKEYQDLLIKDKEKQEKYAALKVQEEELLHSL